jgi:signal transduction histidine kinase
MNGEGWLELRVSKAPGQLGSGVVITRADSGPGIRLNNAQKVFEPFFTTKGEKGTGLGLWISKEIVRKHGGAIRLRTCTEPDRSGTVFRVYLPRVQDDEPGGSSDSERPIR